LNIDDNQIQKLENLPNSISTLNIDDNQIQKLENLPNSIKLLFIENNKLKKIPRDIFEKSKIEQITWKYNDDLKAQLNLEGNPLENPPVEIIKEGKAAILNYFKQQEEEKEKEYLFEAKLLIIGEGGSGKTTFSKKIKDPNANLPDDSTHGIIIDKWNFPIQRFEFPHLKNKAATFFVNLWDFGGQEIYHATHQFFFSKKSLYVLLADTRKQEADFSYWLNTVEQLSGDESKLFILLNKRENHDWAIDELGFRTRFDKIMSEVFTIDLSQSAEIPALQEKIKGWLKKLEGIGQPLIKSWVDIRTAIADEPGDEMSLDRYKEICAKFGRTDEEDIIQISKYFNRIGVFTHYIEDVILQDRIYLNSNKLVKTVYDLLEADLVKKKSGRLSAEEIKEVWKNEQLSQGKMIALLDNFGLMYQANKNLYIIPEHLPKKMPYAKWKHEDKKDILHFTYVFDKYMPKGLMSRLIVALHDYIPNHDLVWHRGVNLSHNEAHAEILEQYGGTNQFDIRIIGVMKRDLLVIITQAFDKILSDFEKLDVEKSIKCPCHECKENDSPYFHRIAFVRNAIKKGKRDIDCQQSFIEVKIKDLIALIDYENLISDLKDSVRKSEMMEMFGIMDRRTMRIEQKLDTYFYHQLKAPQRELCDMLLKELDQMNEHEIFSENESKSYFSQLDKIKENLPPEELERIEKEMDKADLSAKAKLKYSIPIILNFLKYEGEIELSSKRKITWKDIKRIFIKEE
ncbi:MAG: COR domain-containing protein, partial [Saprospiraceae bacterium]